MRTASAIARIPRVYHAIVSPLLPPSCRFVPSCSEYAAEAIEMHGLVRGGVLAVRRLSRCHPWHAGGLDVVPVREDLRSESAGG